MLANRPRGGHRGKDSAQAVDEATLLIDAEQRLCWNEFTGAIEQRAQLFRTRDIATEDDDAAGFYLFDQGARVCVELSARKSYE